MNPDENDLLSRRQMVGSVATGRAAAMAFPAGAQTADPGKTVPSHGRPGQPAELAPVHGTRASSEGRYMTGQIVGASGGRGKP